MSGEIDDVAQAGETFDLGTFVFPSRCVVCDSEDAELVTYTQEHFPVPIPFFGGLHTRSHAELPYCKYHADAFRFRFRVLQITQYAVIATALPCLYAGFVMQEDAQKGNDWLANVLLALAITCLAVVLPVSLVVRRLMYDAFFRYGPNHVQVTSKYPHFVARMREVNGLTPESGVDRQGSSIA
jgi:hypothetical protein